MDSHSSCYRQQDFRRKKTSSTSVPDNESHHFHLDSSFTSAYEQELRAILESPLSSLAPSPVASPLPGPSTRPRSNSDPQADASDPPIQIYFEPGRTSKKIQVHHRHNTFPYRQEPFVGQETDWIHFHFNMAGQQQALAQNQQLPIRGSGKAPSWGWKGPEDSITLPVFFDESRTDVREHRTTDGLAIHTSRYPICRPDSC